MARVIHLRGFRLTKAGKIQRDPKRMDVSAQLRAKASKKIKPARKGALTRHAQADRDGEEYPGGASC